MRLADRMKLRWHRDLASNPTTHAWVLNLYRAGEQHPETVEDYFPHEHAPWPELSRSIARHASDERRHTKLYSAAIEKMGEQVVELGGWDVFNRVIRDHTPMTWAIDEDDTADEKREKLAHFMAHAHCLERRVLRSLEFHMEACEQLGKRRVVKLMEGVYADEARHVAYTREALDELVSRDEGRAILETHSEAEAAADRAFSATQVRIFLERHSDAVSRSSRLLYSACAFLMEQGRAERGR